MLPSTSPSYASEMARYVIDAATLLHLVAEGVEVSPKHQLVAADHCPTDGAALCPVRLVRSLMRRSPRVFWATARGG